MSAAILRAVSPLYSSSGPYFCEPPQGGGQIGLTQHVALLEEITAVQEDSLRFRKAREVLVFAQVLGEPVGNRESVPGQADRRSHDL
jgi:hypothetical protein